MRLLLALLFVSAACITSCEAGDDQWKAFESIFDKNNGPNENESQMNVFSMTMKQIKETKQNQRRSVQVTSYQLEKNNSATYSTFIKRIMFSRNTTDTNVSGPADTFSPPAYDKLKPSVDWVKRGAVTAVKNQGKCNSSYAFAAAGALEALLFKLNAELIPLSVQNMIDCSVDFHNEGCDGGSIENALHYVAANLGIHSESVYPYVGQENKCRHNRDGLILVSVGYTSLVDGNERTLQRAVAKRPVAARLRVCLYSFFLYSGGIYHDPGCKNRITVSVLIVGYGSEGQDYWLLKNSWGTTWGDKGYMMLARNKGNQCGIASGASFPRFDIEKHYKADPFNYLGS